MCVTWVEIWCFAVNVLQVRCLWGISVQMGNPPASASHILGLQVCTTTLCSFSSTLLQFLLLLFFYGLVLWSLSQNKAISVDNTLFIDSRLASSSYSQTLYKEEFPLYWEYHKMTDNPLGICLLSQQRRQRQEDLWVTGQPDLPSEF